MDAVADATVPSGPPWSWPPSWAATSCPWGTPRCWASTAASKSRRGELESGSRIGARYRHTTPEMAVRVAAAIQERLVVVVQVAEAVVQLDGSGSRVSRAGLSAVSGRVRP